MIKVTNWIKIGESIFGDQLISKHGQ